MNDKDIIEHSRLLKNEASKLLYDEGLLSVIKHFGEARIIGSYALDTMTWRDIDISIELPDEQNVALFFKIGEKIAKKFQIAKMSFSNHFIRNFPGYDHGLYWGILLKYAEHEWKIDLWGYGETDYKKHMAEFDELQQKLQYADRNAILCIKHVISQHPEYRGDLYNSMAIYQAVSEDKITSVEEFYKWLKRN